MWGAEARSFPLTLPESVSLGSAYCFKEETLSLFDRGTLRVKPREAQAGEEKPLKEAEVMTSQRAHAILMSDLTLSKGQTRHQSGYTIYRLLPSSFVFISSFFLCGVLLSTTKCNEVEY